MSVKIRVRISVYPANRPADRLCVCQNGQSFLCLSRPTYSQPSVPMTNSVAVPIPVRLWVDLFLCPVDFTISGFMVQSVLYLSEFTSGYMAIPVLALQSNI
ncbi:hypothetical protein EZS27_011345 [termite gut metagenome]|uniref:Uncharacterized protein n=1 Tax=termite gut metagenome TaxID=433724 RepID=A0A5J4S628_9ZZZZ